MPSNTTNEQDDIIKNARKGLIIEVEKIIAIIDDLDRIITEWMIATDCETPAQAKRKMEDRQ